MKFDLKNLSTVDRAIAGGAAVAFIAGFLPWWGVSSGLFGVSVSGWSAGFTAWAGTLLLTLAGVYLVLRRSGVSLPDVGVGPSVLVAGVAALGLLLVIIRWLTLPRYHGIGVGTRYGIWIAIIAGAAEVAAAIVQLRASGEPLPWAQSSAGSAPAPASPPAEPTPEPGGAVPDE
jgi:hypothetical protein